MSRNARFILLAALCAAAGEGMSLAASIERVQLDPSIRLVQRFPGLQTALAGQFESLLGAAGRLPGAAPVPVGEELVRQIALNLIDRRAVILKDAGSRAILGPDAVRGLRAVRKRQLKLPALPETLDLTEPGNLLDAQKRLSEIFGETASAGPAPEVRAASEAEEGWRRLPPPRRMPKAVEKGFAPVNGIELHYAVYGSGSPVLMLHGGLANSEYWGGQVSELAKRRKVIVVDSRGHGRSTRTERPYSYGLMTADVLALLDRLKLPKVSVVGWSDGGIIGLDLAINHPERLERLFAFGANYDLSGLTDDADQKAAFKAYLARTAEDYKRLSRTPEEYAAFLAAVGAMWASEPNMTADQLRSIKVPVTIAHGEFDEAIKRSHAEEMAGLIGKSKLVILRGVSHFAMLQDPRLFNKALLDFLAAK